MSKIHLSGNMVGHVDDESGKALIVKVVASRAIGPVVDANGQDFDLSPEVLRAIVDNYNRRVKEEFEATVVHKKRIPIAKRLIERIMGKPREQFTINDIALLPVQVEHEMHVMRTIGTVVGLLEISDWEGKECIIANLLISDADAVSRIDGGRLHQVSISFSYPELEADEISFTVYGAVKESNIIAIQEGTKMEYSKPETAALMKPIEPSFADEVSKIQLSLQSINQEDKTNKVARQQLQFKLQNKNIALDLVKSGKIYAKFKNFIADDFSKFSTPKDRDLAVRIFSTMPAVIKGPRNLNKLALRTEDLLYEPNLKEKTMEFKKDFYTTAEIEAQRRIDLGRGKKKLSTPAEGKEDVDDESKKKDADMSAECLVKEGHELSLDTMEKHIHGPDHEAEFKERMSNHAKMGTHKEGFEEYCKFHKIDMSEAATVDIKPTDIKEVSMSESEEDKKTKEELEELDKKDADLSERKEGLEADLKALTAKYCK